MFDSFKMIVLFYYLLLLSIFIVLTNASIFPMVVNTWAGNNWHNATDNAFLALQAGQSAIDAVVEGCRTCQTLQCDGTVGYGGSPDETGETTLDAMIMNGDTMDSGSVADLRRIKDAIGVARLIMEYTTHTMLAGDQATAFAVANGFVETNLSTPVSTGQWKSWLSNNCQPNYRVNVSPDPTKSCGPYTPNNPPPAPVSHTPQASHDTLSLIVITADGHMAAGTTTNGAGHKIPGRVGDGPITGSGSYVDSDVGGCGATGDGDIMMRFLPCYQAIENVRLGMSVQDAGLDALSRIGKKFPNYQGAIVVVDKEGNVAGSCWNWVSSFSVRMNGMNATESRTGKCTNAKEMNQKHQYQSVLLNRN